MIEIKRLNEILEGYKIYFPDHWRDEQYKWEAIRHFQKYWDMDALDFAAMFKKAMEKTANLLASGYAYPRGMIVNFAKADDQAVRKMFQDLFNETMDLGDRIQAFQMTAEILKEKYDDGTWKNHYQSTNAVSTYLWLRYPDKYYIYKYELYRNMAVELHAEYRPKRDGSVESLIGGYRMYDEICKVIAEDHELVDMFRNTVSENCYPDPMLKTLTMDVGFYLSRFFLEKRKKKEEEEGWFPENYDPGISVDRWVELLQDSSVFTMSSLQIMKRIREYGGKATCTQLSIKYGETKNFYSVGSSGLARRVAEKTGCKVMQTEQDTIHWWPVLYMGKAADEKEQGSYVWRLRKELDQALEKTDLSEIPLYADAESVRREKKDKQRYWWLTANPKIWSFADIRIGEEQNYTFYNENGNKRRIFQNFLDVKAGDLLIGYEANPVKKVVALGEITQVKDGENFSFTKTEGLSVPIEYAALKEYAELDKMEFFVQPNGSLFKLTRGEFDFFMDVIREENPVKTVSNTRVRYTKDDFLNEVFMTEERFNVLEALLRNKKNIILQGAPGVGKTFAAKKLAYAMMGETDDTRIEFVQFHQNYSYEDFIMGYRPDGAEFKLTEGIFYRFCQLASNHPDQDYFFIIDEINRGNMSKIFGELLMLIEKDYRGTKATLAYSGMPFAVPENIYIIGMMNTADRSLAMIDYALRRRFSFFEMEPGFHSDGFQKYQSAFENETFDALINQIKYLNKQIAEDPSLGKGFRIGHSYFCGREKNDCTTDWMRSIVEFDILPMLSEYWFDEPTKLKNWENKLIGVFDDE